MKAVFLFGNFRRWTY